MNRPMYFLILDSKSPNTNSNNSAHALAVIFFKKIRQAYFKYESAMINKVV
jgi:hypothetical protein